MYDYLVVGAGFAGSVISERLARIANKKVLLVDRRPHIGGNAYDHYNSDGILVHKYGPHIFHTNSRDVLEYLSQFTEWRPYEHHVLASISKISTRRDLVQAWQRKVRSRLKSLRFSMKQ